MRLMWREFLILVCAGDAIGQAVWSRYENVQGVHVVTVAGSDHVAMGKAYGEKMNDILLGTLEHLISAFWKHGISRRAMIEQAGLLRKRFAYTWIRFLEGVAEGAGLAIDDIWILNAMETLSSLLPNSCTAAPRGAPGCAFLFVPPEKSSDESGLVGRNYDYDTEYAGLADNLTVTVLVQENSLATAIVGLPGQVYCPSCINSRGLFAELNNGMPSGGFSIHTERQSMLIRMLEALQASPSIEALANQMQASESDFSLVVNTADAQRAQAFEYSSNASLGMKPFTPPAGEIYASTNYFLNQSWPWEHGVPIPRDNSTWQGVTRRYNLRTLAKARTEGVSFAAMKQIMARPLHEGGARTNETIYQMVFNPGNLMLSLHRPSAKHASWVDVDLGNRFSSMVSDLTWL